MKVLLYITDCSCGNNLELSSSCLGATVQDNSIGEYEKVCVQDDNTQVYQHTTLDLYLYYESNLQVIIKIIVIFFTIFNNICDWYF